MKCPYCKKKIVKCIYKGQVSFMEIYPEKTIYLDDYEEGFIFKKTIKQAPIVIPKSWDYHTCDIKSKK